MGIRGGPHPHERICIGSMLGDVLADAGARLAEYGDLEPFQVTVLHPGRTLLEKLVHIHSLAQRLACHAGEPARPRDGRHFYDVFQLLGDARVLDLLGDQGQTGQVLDSIEQISRTYFGRGAGDIRPPGGFATSAAFDSGSGISRRLRVAYEAGMPELYFGTDPLPTWDDICRRINAAGELL
jgi:hypothetical protein